LLDKAKYSLEANVYSDRQDIPHFFETQYLTQSSP